MTRASLFSGFFLLALVVPRLTLAAETNYPATMPDRYLLVVDISSPMRAREEALAQSLNRLLLSGIEGQIQTGDELGIWTYNNQLHTGEFDLLEWREGIRHEVASRVLRFLENQHFSGATDFSKVMPDLMDVVQHSRRITVILFSDGDEVIYGTPFDDAIANDFSKNVPVCKDKKVPILTVLRGYQGHLIGHSMSYPPWPVAFPEFPPEPEKVAAPAERTVAPTQPDLSRTLMNPSKGPIVFAQPLIVTGKPAPSVQSPEKAVAPAAAKPASDAETNAPSPAPGAASPPAPETQRVVAATQPAPGGTSAAGSPAQNTEDHSGFRRVVKLVGLGIVVLVAVLAALLLMRRPRDRHRGSLITQSMAKKKRRR